MMRANKGNHEHVSNVLWSAVLAVHMVCCPTLQRAIFGTNVINKATEEQLPTE